MEIIRTGRVHYLAPYFEKKEPATVQGFTTRHEGVSRPPFNSLNLGFNTEDSPHNVEGNRSLLARTFGLSLDRLVTVKQCHSSNILVLDSPNHDFAHFQELDADAIITDQTDLMIGVTIADCVPLLLYDPVKRVIAAVHAGWQGTAASIAVNTVQGMQSVFGCNPADIKAAIGPAINPCCYQVDQPVRDGFKEQEALWAEISEPDGDGKWRLNLVLANRMQLNQAGLTDENIQFSSRCVCCQKEFFFSYRRDGKESGRQIGFILLKG